MNLIKTSYGWKTDDEAGFWLSERAHSTLPTSLMARRAGQVSLEREPTVPVDPAGMTLIGRGEFGPGRPCHFDTRVKWSGDSHRYAIYRYQPNHSAQTIVIAESHGGGEHFYYLEGSSNLTLWECLVASLSTERLWDLCYTLAGTYNFATKSERRRLYESFAQGRLRKRKRQGSIYVEESAAVAA